MFKQMGAPPPEIVLIHHTDCGMERLVNPQLQAGLSKVTGLPAERIAQLAIHDHDDSLRQDLEALRGSGIVPDGLEVFGLRFDHESGQLQIRFQETT